MLELVGVHSGYGRLPVLFDINLTVQSGEVLAVLGANGAGKSTLMKTITGVVPARQGVIVFDGARVDSERPHKRFRRGIAFSPEGRRIFPSLTVRDNLRSGTSGIPEEVVGRQIELIHELFPILHERARQPAGSLSGGEQQMLAIGRALVSNPKLLLVDEVSMGLAPLIVDELYAALRLLADANVATIVVDQFASRGMVAHADRACVMEQGSVVFEGSHEEAQARLLAAMPGA